MIQLHTYCECIKQRYHTKTFQTVMSPKTFNENAYKNCCNENTKKESIIVILRQMV